MQKHNVRQSRQSMEERAEREERIKSQQDIFDPHTQEILEARARALAQPPPTASADDVMSLVVLTLGTERYGVDIRAVVEIQPAGPITRLPGVPPMWLGLTNLRGRLYPVLDLCRYLALDRPLQGAAARRLVLVAGTDEGADLEIGFVVDDVPQVRQVSLADLSAPLVEPSSGQPGVLIGITADMLTVLDVDKLLRDPRLVVQEAFSQ
ncbi:MAG: chemotaxis protein CheW [Anaerolineae bacterium]